MNNFGASQFAFPPWWKLGLPNEECFWNATPWRQTIPLNNQPQSRTGEFKLEKALIHRFLDVGAGFYLMGTLSIAILVHSLTFQDRLMLKTTFYSIKLACQQTRRSSSGGNMVKWATTIVTILSWFLSLVMVRLSRIPVYVLQRSVIFAVHPCEAASSQFFSIVL